MNSILFPTDFSQNANNAFLYAKKLAQQKSKKLNLLHIYEVPLMAPANAFITREATSQLARTNMRKVSQEKFDQLIDNHDLKVYPHRCFLREGNVVDEILKLTKNEEVDLIVMGTKGKTDSREFLMGSVTADIIRKSFCPVLAIPEVTIYKPIQRIVYATDLRYDETQMFRHIVGFAKQYNSTVIFLHINDDGFKEEIHEESLQNFIDNSDYGKLAYMKIMTKDIASGISDYIDSNNIDLLAMTTHTKSLYQRLFHRSITKQMVLHTQIPLLAFSKEVHPKVFF
jgi:nucleotide-binding universal stress UspA family protein